MGFIQHQIPPFYCRRTFSDKFNDTTNFITSNWRILLKMLAIVLLPLCAIQALNINGLISSFYGNVQDGDETATSTIVGFVLNYCSLFVFSLVATALFISIVYALMRLYHSTNDDGTPQYADLSKMTFTQFRPFMMRQMRSAWKSIGAMVLIGILMLVLFVALVVLIATTTIAGNSESGIVFIVLLVYSSIFMLVPPLMMVIPAYSFEETKFLNGLKKGVLYGFKTWRGVIALIFVFGLIISIVCGTLSLPWIILSFVKIYFVADGSSSASFVNTPWYGFLTYIAGIFYLFVCYIGYAAMLVALAYQYGHAHEAVDGDDF